MAHFLSERQAEDAASEEGGPLTLSGVKSGFDVNVSSTTSHTVNPHGLIFELLGPWVRQLAAIVTVTFS